MKNRVKAIPSNPYKKDDVAMMKSLATLFISFLVLSSAMYLLTPYRYCLSTGWSMTPTLEALNVNVVDTGVKDIQVGDIVLAQSPRSGRYITHTVIAIDAKGYLLKGDNEITNPVADGYVPLASIKGEVVSVPFTNIPVSLGGTGILSLGLLLFAFVVAHDILEHEGPRTKANRSVGFLLALAVIVLIISVIV